MKKPDIIYVHRGLHLGMLTTTVIKVGAPDEEEYIRKDALLEWLKKEYETTSWYYEKMKHVTGCVGDNSSSGKAEAYKKVIDKIESL